MLIRKQRPEWLWLLTLTTAMYLLVEFAFNARLLDVVGGMPTDDQLHNIEEYGRRISGFAVALLFWGAIFEANRSKISGQIVWGKALVYVAACTFVIVQVVYHAEGRLVDTLVDESSPATRATAVSAVVLQKTLASGQVDMKGLDLETTRLGDPDGKAFLALYAPLTSYLPDLDMKISGVQQPLADLFVKLTASPETNRSKRQQSTDIVNLMRAKPAAFADGQQLEREGKRFARTMIVPAIALGFSILGALVHVWKLFFFLLHLGAGRVLRASWAKGLLITSLSLATLFAFILIPSTDITQQPQYRHLKNKMYEHADDDFSLAMRKAVGVFSDATIHAQPVMYPIFEWTRVRLLGGMEFGYVRP